VILFLEAWRRNRTYLYHSGFALVLYPVWNSAVENDAVSRLEAASSSPMITCNVPSITSAHSST